MNDILELAQSYFDLLYTCDVTNFDSVFHPNAQLHTVGKDGYAVLTAARYREVLRERKSPASQQAEREDEIVNIDRSSDTTAIIKVRALINGTRYCDYLALLKVADRWVIVSKIYAIV
jgi:hypothetical protein